MLRTRLGWLLFNPMGGLTMVVEGVVVTVTAASNDRQLDPEKIVVLNSR